MLIKFYGFYLVFVSKIQVGIGFEGIFFQQSVFLWFPLAERGVNNFFLNLKFNLLIIHGFVVLNRCFLLMKTSFLVD